MQKKHKQILALILSALALIIGYSLFHSKESAPRIFQTEQPIRTDIVQTVFAPGVLKAKNQIKVGSLVTGVAKKIYVNENDFVNEGQLLIEIDTGREDWDVKEAEAILLSKEAELEYWIKHYERQERLHAKSFVSDATVQEAIKSLLVAENNVKAAKAVLSRAELEYQNTRITAPGKGIVTSVGISRGERVTTDLNATVICVIAPDVSKMEAKIFVDERDIGAMKTTLPVTLFMDAFPEKRFESTLDEVSFSPTKTDGGKMAYEVYAYLNNPELLLHPGMHFSSEIEAAIAANVLAIHPTAFLINQHQIQLAAKLLGYSFTPLSIKEKDAFLEANALKNAQFVWKKEGSNFIEVPIIVGINNGVLYEIVSGLEGHEELVINLLEENELRQLYEEKYG